MSRKHPQNGPSLSKAPAKKKKPLTDEELSQLQAKEKAHELEFQEKAKQSKRFSKAVRASGGMIPVRGAGTAEFLAAVHDDPAQSKRFIDDARDHGADETKEGADRAFKKVAKPPPKAERGRS